MENFDLKKTLKIILTALLVFIIYVACGATIPYIKHKQVSDEYIRKFESEYYVIPDETSYERVMCIDDNTEALIYRLKMFEAAEEEIIISTFDFYDDDSGRDVMAALLNAANRGVDVKILTDGLTSMLRMNNSAWFAALDAHPNISIRRYNTMNLFTPWTIQARLHDKYIIIDSSMYLLGGRNTCNLFLGDYQSAKNHDREILVTSDGVSTSSLHSLKKYFSDMWQLECNTQYNFNVSEDEQDVAIEALSGRYANLKETYPEAFEDTDWHEITCAAERITLLCNPTSAGNKAPELWYSLNRIMADGDNITILTPYIICSDEMYSDLTTLSAASDKVELIINSTENGANPSGCSDYINEAENVRNTGMTVYEYSGRHSTHIKTILVDDNISIVGSLNFDMRSVYLDTELMLVIDCPELNSELRSQAADMIASSKTYKSADEYVYGIDYIDKTLPFNKKATYTILKYILKPFRFLL